MIWPGINALAWSGIRCEREDGADRSEMHSDKCVLTADCLFRVKQIFEESLLLGAWERLYLREI